MSLTSTGTNISYKKLQTKKEKFHKFVKLLYTIPRPSIVYATEKSHATGVYSLIKNLGFQRVASYRETPNFERQEILTKWKNGSWIWLSQLQRLE